MNGAAYRFGVSWDCLACKGHSGCCHFFLLFNSPYLLLFFLIFFFSFLFFFLFLVFFLFERRALSVKQSSYGSCGSELLVAEKFPWHLPYLGYLIESIASPLASSKLIINFFFNSTSQISNILQLIHTTTRYNKISHIAMLQVLISRATTQSFSVKVIPSLKKR